MLTSYGAMLPSASSDTNMRVLSVLDVLPVLELLSRQNSSPLVASSTSSSSSANGRGEGCPSSSSVGLLCSILSTSGRDSWLTPCPARTPGEQESSSITGKGSLRKMSSLSWRMNEDLLLWGWRGDELRMGEQPSTYGLSPHWFTAMFWLREGRPSGDRKDNRFLSPSSGRKRAQYSINT